MNRPARYLAALVAALCLFAVPAGAASTHLIQTNFTAGELSPLMEGRVDMAKYQNGCLELENFLVHPHGPAAKRPGFCYIAETKDSSKRSRLIPFEFSTDQAYVIEMGDQYMRFYMDRGQILWTTGGTPYEIASPYTEDELDDVKYCQSADVMYMCHPSHDVYVLERSGHTDWGITEISGASAFTNDPFAAANDYPSCCTFHENRLVFANTNNEPNTVWFSKSGDFTDFTGGVTGYNGSDILQTIDTTALNIPVENDCLLTIYNGNTTTGQYIEIQDSGNIKGFNGEIFLDRF